MDTKQVIQSQYFAALAMLQEAIEKCPETIWDSSSDEFKLWSKAYHTLFYVHLYLQKSEKDFVRWEKHRDPDGDIPITKDEIFEYLDFIKKHIAEWILATDLNAESGFHWYPVNKLELQFINIRHIQQHAGEMYECLGARDRIELGWHGYSHKN